MPTAELGDVSIHYELAGPDDGPRLVYVSGSGSDLRVKPHALSSPFPRTFRTVGYDHRGLGRSTQGPNQPTMQDFADDLHGLLDHLGWDTCRAVGISFGGMVLMHAAADRPERFERLVLGCTSPGGAGGASYPLHEVEGLAETPGAAAQLEARRHHDCWDRLDLLTMPVLVAAGRTDPIAFPENQDAMMTRLPNAELAWFDGGHAFMLEDKAANPAMIDFLAA